MKAVICKTWGPADKLVIENIASPTAGPGEVVITVKAAGLNFFDTLLIEGKYQFRPEPPFSPAAEAAGIIKEVGDGITHLQPGDHVMCYAIWGCAREEIVIAAHKVVKIPSGLDFPAASGLTVTYGTTLHALRDRADAQPGETMAVLGASGGVGQAAIEIGKAMGLRIIACASSDDKLEFCRQLGANETINYATTNLKDELKRLSDGKGVNIVYDAVGGDFTEAALRATSWGGRFLVIGFATGTIPKIPLNLVLLKGCQMVGVFWGDHIEREPEKHRANMACLVDWAATGKIAPHIYKTYSLEQTPDALDDIAQRKVRGKAIIIPGQ